MNSLAIAEAIAARFQGVTATSEGETRTIVARATVPNGIAKGPLLIVFPPTGELSYTTGMHSDDVLLYPVRLIADPLNYPERSKWLYAYFDAMRHKVGEQYRLGLSYVVSAEAISVTTVLDGFVWGKVELGGVVCDLVELIVRVKVYEPVPTLAP